MHTDTIIAAPPPPPHPVASRIGPAPGGADCTFGRFARHAARKLLVYGLDGRQVVLGGRAFDLLLALVARAGEVVEHDELVTAVWPCSVVDDSCLRVHVGGLRRALGDCASATRCVANVAGRGYSFVARVERC